MKKPAYMVLAVVGEQAANDLPQMLLVFRGTSREIADRVAARERRKNRVAHVVKVLRARKELTSS